jgi:phosphohistidine phosphatase SixA
MATATAARGGDGDRFVILVRHGKRHVRWDADEAAHELVGWTPEVRANLDAVSTTISSASDFAQAGLNRTIAIAGRLADELGRHGVRVVRIRSGHHVVAQQTARAVAAVLRTRGVAAHLEPGHDEHGIALWDALDPEVRGAGDQVREASDGWRARTPAEAWILVGHQPQLTRIAACLTRRSLHRVLPRSRATPGVTLPIGGSEAACIDLNRRQVVWMLTEKSADLMKELQDKLKSKFDVAKFFLGAFVVNTGLLLKKELFEKAPAVDMALAGLGVFCALVALGFTAATLFSYDRLLMPTEFWGEAPQDRATDRPSVSTRRWRVLRPPSQAQVVLYYEMVHAWTWFFVPAVTFAFGSIALLVLSLADRVQVDASPAANAGWRLAALAVTCAAAFAIGLVAYRVGRPDWGTSD